jgi:hypothetical protein
VGGGADRLGPGLQLAEVHVYRRAAVLPGLRHERRARARSPTCA